MEKLTKPSGLSEIDNECVNTIRCLSMDAIQAANSGHPGLPLGMAAGAFEIWSKHMRYNPKNPKWLNRDRFVLSAGHGSMLLYSLLHLTGFDLSLEDIKNFRQMGSKAPGHPEYGWTDGVELTTGPLGQGIANAVGMAIAEKYLEGYFNKEDAKLIDYDVYVVVGDGCLQEGVAAEASAMAGHAGLDNLIVIHDDNHITIDGDTSIATSEDIAKRYEAYGWYVQKISGDGTNNVAELNEAIANAKKQEGKPSLIQFQTTIGYSSPKEGTHNCHGAPLGEEGVRIAKERLGCDPDKKFFISDDVKARFAEITEQGIQAEKAWDQLFADYKAKYPELAQQFEDAANKKLPVDLDEILPKFEAGTSMATRGASGKVLNAIMPKLPLLLGGSADLTPSNNTGFDGFQRFSKENRKGRYLSFGIREHAMGAVLNGIALNELVDAYGGTFFVFSDYMTPALRVAALSHYPSLFVFTHDSIGVGEDGPTHQPVEQLAGLRAMPGINILRPAEANETVQAWKYMLTHRDQPHAIVLTRQNLPTLDQEKYAPATNLEKGAYVLAKGENPQVILMATGSEVALATEAYERLAAEGIEAQLVSMPCWELFNKQDQAYKDSVLPPAIKARVAAEAAVKQGWDAYLGDKGVFIGMNSFGMSAPAGQIFEKLGITTDAMVAAAKELIG